MEEDKEDSLMVKFLILGSYNAIVAINRLSICTGLYGFSGSIFSATDDCKYPECNNDFV